MKTASITVMPWLVLFALACETESHPVAPAIQAMSFANSEWSDPVNLGPGINTAFNEQGPNLSNDGLNRGRRSEEHTSELQSRLHLVCRLLLEKKKRKL